ncbi:glycoside hydrolase family 25 protein [Streptomyces nojiriensis]|uniref:glycoside hydrolase family 25 protein n=1 Tax=Streptomyces nojiriensis TaxID=66374 RepID=UPI0036500DB9
MGSTESLGTKGVELSTLASAAAFRNMRSQGVEFVIMRGYQSVGRVDPNLATTVANAWDAGMSNVDVFQFPCFSCSNAAGQANTLISYMKDNAVKYGTVWLDVEGPGTYWGSNTSANAAFIADWVQAMKDDGVNIGIYTSESQWVPIVGSYTGGSTLPLWYTHRDGKQNFDDFKPFSGWTKPDMKSYNDVVSQSGVGVTPIWNPR